MNKKITLLLIIIFAFLIRLFLTTTAHHGDLNNNISWGQIAGEKGLPGFYGSDNSDDWPFSAPNQPPLYILMFTVLSEVWQIIRNFIFYLNWELLIFPSKAVWFWDEKGMDVMVKLPSIIADLGIGWLIYKFLQKTKDKRLKALNVSAIWLFNPVTIYNSAVWGGTDSVVNLIGLLSTFALMEKRLVKALVLFTIAFLFKGSLMIFTPLVLMVALLQKHSATSWFKAILYSLITLVSISIWFYPHIDFPLWFINLYRERILPGEIGFLTANAFNFWWLIDSGSTNDNQIYFGLPARLWGFILTLTGVAGILVWLKRKFVDERIIAAFALIAIITFLFMTRIHERYLYPFFPYATLLLAFIPNFLVLYIAITLIHLLNLYHLFWIPTFPLLENLYLNPNFAKVLSLASIAILITCFRQFKSAKI